SYAAHGSGEIIVAFSTANQLNRSSSSLTHAITAIRDRATGPLYEAVIEATEEAIVNSLCMAEDMTGQSGNFPPALPLERVVELLKKSRPWELGGPACWAGAPATAGSVPPSGARAVGCAAPRASGQIAVPARRPAPRSGALPPAPQPSTPLL